MHYVTYLQNLPYLVVWFWGTTYWFAESTTLGRCSTCLAAALHGIPEVWQFEHGTLRLHFTYHMSGTFQSLRCLNMASKSPLKRDDNALSVYDSSRTKLAVSVHQQIFRHQIFLECYERAPREPEVEAESPFLRLHMRPFCLRNNPVINKSSG